MAVSGAAVCTALSAFHARAFSCHHADLIRHFPKSTIPHMTYHVIIKKESALSPTLITLLCLLSCLTKCLSMPLTLAETLLVITIIGNVAWSSRFFNNLELEAALLLVFKIHCTFAFIFHSTRFQAT